MGDRVVCVQRQRPVDEYQCLVVTPLMQERLTDNNIGPKVVGFYLDRFIEGGKCICRAVQAVKYDPSIEMGTERIGRKFNRFIDCVKCLFKAV